MNRTGVVPGYAAGGIVHPVPGYPPNWGRGYHGSDRGLDIPAPGGTPILAMRDAIVTAVNHWGYSYGNHVRLSDGSIYAHMLQTLATVGQKVTAGTRIGLVGNTGNSFGNHLHVVGYDRVVPVGEKQGGGGGLLDFDPIQKLKDTVAGPLKRLDELGNNAIVKLVKAAPGKLVDGMVEKVKTAATSFMAASDAGAGPLPAGGAVERWRPLVLQALRMVGESESLVDITLRRLNQESSGNPSIVNNWDSNAKRGTPSKGLMQVIDPTFRQYAMPGYSTNIFDPLSNILASMRYAKARYGSLARAYNRPGGYDSGGWLPPGITPVVNNTGKPEAVFTGDQFDRLIAALEGVASDEQVMVLEVDGQPIRAIARRVSRAEIDASNRRKVS